MGRKQRGHNDVICMTAAYKPINSDSMRGTCAFVRPDHSGLIRSLHEAVVGWWTNAQPRNRTALGMRARMMEAGRSEPFRPLVVLAVAAIDEGKPVSVVTKPFRDLIAAIEQHAKAHQVPGVLPFRQRFLRLWQKEIREGADQDCAATSVNEDDAASLDRFIIETDEQIEVLVAARECARQRRAELRA